MFRPSHAPRPVRAGALVGLLLAGIVAGGCAAGDAPGTLWETERVRAWPFAPAEVRVHPLSRVQQSPERLLILHVELLDPWHDTTKCVGMLRIIAGPPGGEAMQWDVDLRDAELNASLYDASTRTYRVQLRGVQVPRGANELAVRIEFTGPGPDGRERTLTDESVVRVDAAPEE